MSATFDPAALSTAEIGDLLHQLEQQERSLSRRRRQLHNRLDFVRGTTPDAAEQISFIEGQEKELSEQRRELQHQIDALRTERARRDRSDVS